MNKKAKLVLAIALLLAAAAVVWMQHLQTDVVATGFLFGLPFYLIPTLLVIWLWAILRRLRARRRQERAAWLQGRCVGCEYDLTGNQSGVCPECGRAIEPAQS